MLEVSIALAPPRYDSPVSPAVLAEAAARGISNLLISHLRARDASRPANGAMPHSHYWAAAADSVTTTPTRKTAHGAEAVVKIAKEGVRLHLYGGEVRPRSGKKALAIPLVPAVAGMWPSEAADAGNTLVWPKGAKAGWIQDKTGRHLWLLVPKVNIAADPRVLPDENAFRRAAEEAAREAL